MPKQIRIDPSGPWHSRERVDGGDRTSCGDTIHVFSSRDGGVDDLCPQCFTQSEIETGRVELAIREHAEEDGSLYHADEEPTDPNGHIDPLKETK